MSRVLTRAREGEGEGLSPAPVGSQPAAVSPFPFHPHDSLGFHKRSIEGGGRQPEVISRPAGIWKGVFAPLVSPLYSPIWLELTDFFLGDIVATQLVRVRLNVRFRIPEPRNHLNLTQLVSVRVSGQVRFTLSPPFHNPAPNLCVRTLLRMLGQHAGCFEGNGHTKTWSVLIIFMF